MTSPADSPTMSEKNVPFWNLANQLTLARLGMSVIIFLLIELEQWEASLGLFILAAITDWLDGFVARRYGLSTPLGRMLDPLIDKVLNTGMFVFFTARPEQDSGLYAWMVVLIVSREFLITGLRSFLEQQNIEFGADLFGKAKTVLQFLAISLILFVYILSQYEMDDMVVVVAGIFRNALIWSMVLATAGSGVNYCIKARNSWQKNKNTTS